MVLTNKIVILKVLSENRLKIIFYRALNNAGIFLESCLALSAAGGKFPLSTINATSVIFNSAYYITAKPGHVIWLNFKLLPTQTAFIKVLNKFIVIKMRFWVDKFHPFVNNLFRFTTELIHLPPTF